jgi:hypothetical protein
MWQIELAGDAMDIETLKELASAVDATVTPGPDGRYCLGGATFGQLVTADEARVHAGKILARLNGAARFDDPEHGLVQLGTSVYDRRAPAHHHVFIEVGVKARAKVGATVFVFGPPGAFDTHPAESPSERSKRLLVDPGLTPILEA